MIAIRAIKEMGSVMRWVISGGMARGIEDPKARAAVITLYIDKRPFTQAFDIRTEEAIILVVVDRLGVSNGRPSAPTRRKRNWRSGRC